MRSRPIAFHPLLLGGAALLLAATPALAAPSTNATVNLIQLLIKQKVITRAAGEALLAQAEAEAAAARAALAQAAPPAAAPQQQAALPPAAAGSIRVPYVPESVRAAMTQEIKGDIMAQAEFEGWARPNQVPGWVKGISLYGDIRFRSQSDFYSNNNTDELIDFQTFNEISPIDINANTNPTGFPLLNTRRDQVNRFRLRARLGLLANINDNVSAGVRLATGDDNSPISTNQLLGGGFAKKNIWLDQAYIKVTPVKWASVTLGRFVDPFVASELEFDDDLNFDGAVAQLDAKPWLPPEASAGLTVGAFPLGYSPANFPTNASAKSGNDSRWLYAVQGRGGWTIDERINLSGAVAYYSFARIQGELSEPCALYNGNRQCSTDTRRPVFLRKGNTLFLTRDILPDPASPLNYAQPQLLGLAFDYKVIDVQANVRVPVRGDIGVELQGNYLNNLGFDASALCRYNPKGLPINNINIAPPVKGADPSTPAGQFYSNPCTRAADGRIATFNGGHQGYGIRALVGYTRPRVKGEWNVEVGYRYLESDAMLDSFTDSDFHLGGTNAKGYVLGGRFALYKNLVLSGKWLSANEVSGPPLAIDVLQLDLTAAF